MFKTLSLVFLLVKGKVLSNQKILERTKPNQNSITKLFGYTINQTIILKSKCSHAMSWFHGRMCSRAIGWKIGEICI